MIYENTPAKCLIDVLNAYQLRGDARRDAVAMLMAACAGEVSVFSSGHWMFAATRGRNGEMVVAVEVIYPGGREAAKALAVASLAMRGRAQGVRK